MKENVLDLLMYLFENYIYDEPDTTPDRETLSESLEEAGFTANEIERAFAWLDELSAQRQLAAAQPIEPASKEGIPAFPSNQIPKSCRVFSPEETERLDLDARGLLLYLENMGVLDPISRELVIDRLMALDADEVSMDDVKWVVLMVLFNQPGQEASYAWMEELMFDEEGEYRH
jgi:Smg protein